MKKTRKRLVYKQLPMDLFILYMAGNCLVIKPLHILSSDHHQILIMCILNNFFLLAQDYINRLQIQKAWVRSWSKIMEIHNVRLGSTLISMHFMALVFRMRTSNKKSPDFYCWWTFPCHSHNLHVWFTVIIIRRN